MYCLCVCLRRGELHWPRTKIGVPSIARVTWSDGFVEAMSLEILDFGASRDVIACHGSGMVLKVQRAEWEAQSNKCEYDNSTSPLTDCVPRSYGLVQKRVGERMISVLASERYPPYLL